MNRETSEVLKGILWLWLVIFLLGISHQHNQQQNRQKWIAFAADLKPQIDEARRSIVAFHPTGAQTHSPRPYTIVYIGRSSASIFAHRNYDGIINLGKSSTPPTATSIKTLILLEDEENDSATYQVKTLSKDTGYLLGVRNDVYKQHRYHLWAIEVASGRVKAFIALQDGALEPNSPGSRINDDDFRKWADSVTTEGTTHTVPSKQ